MHPKHRVHVSIQKLGDFGQIESEIYSEHHLQKEGDFSPDFDFDAESSAVSDPDSVTVLSALPVALPAALPMLLPAFYQWHCQRLQPVALPAANQ